MGAKRTEWGLGEQMKYLTEGLPKKQVNVLRKLGPQTSSSGFYLAGGTALAIYLGHRVSVDLDWFTSDVFEDGMLIAQSLRNSNIQVEIEQVSPGTLHGSVNGVRVTFLQYQYPLLRPLNYWSEMEFFSLQEMLDLYQKKFNIRDVGSVLYGLVYFDDAESERMPRMLWDVNWGEIKKSILESVKNIS